MSQYHQSVLLQEVVNYLNPGKGKKYIDATIGGAGHSLELLKKGAQVLGIDRDPEAIKHIKNKFQIGKGLILVNANFSDLAKIARSHNFTKVDGVIFDLGVSSKQLDSAKRGFSFQKQGPLDMRMDSQIQIKAKDLVNNFDQRRLHEIFKTYGQEKLSRPIASAIYSARQIKPIETTEQLSRLVQEVYSKYRVKTKIHPATKVFLALRIVVNSELLNLQESLPQTLDLLKKGGRLVIISFHSLEDAIVKRFLKGEKQLKVLTKKPIGPAAREVQINPRSRSAKLRVAEKI